MSRTACIIFGTCLALQMPLTLGANSSAPESAMPLFHHQHSKELLQDDAFPQDVKGQEYATYLERRMRELLPLPYRPGATRIASALIDTANKYKMDPLFLMAVIQQESRFNPLARGAHGEIGLMQLKPTTAQWVIEKHFGKAPSQAQIASLLEDPAMNIVLGTAYLAHLRSKFDNRSRFYISAYNMGASKLRSRLREGYEPQEYRTKVLAGYVEFLGELMPRPRAAREIAASKTFAL